MTLDPAVQNGLYAAIGAGAGAGLKALVDWWLRRDERKETREAEIARANDELAAKLREELRLELTRRDAENQTLRDRLALVEGRADELGRVNAELRSENLELTRLNATQQAQIASQSGEIARHKAQIATQAAEISNQKAQITTQAAEISRLQKQIDQLRIDLNRRPDTGPLPGA